ncbi:MAG: ATP-grasp domain-containing protein [Candidatus Nanopelagicales bacterium]
MTSAREAPPIRVGLATCAALPNGDEDESLLAAALNDRGVDTEWVVWSASDPDAMGERFDAVVIRSTWDYVDDREAFVGWVEACTAPVWNSASVVRWNSDKRYMLDLLEAGVPTVPTHIVATLDQDWSVPQGCEEIVVKPAVGAGSRGAQRFRVADEINEARHHAGAIIDSGNTAVVQPYLASVDSGSETALIHIDGQFSHSVSKGPLLRRDGSGEWVEGLYLAEDIDHREVGEQQLVVARAALEAAPPGDVLYARVDLVDDDNGAPMVLELELIEPSLFFAFDAGSAQKMADAIVARATTV